MNYVRTARKALKMTQAELAAALGRSQPSVSRYESEPDSLDESMRLAVRGLLAERRVKMP